MRLNSFDWLSLGTFYQGQGTQNAVERTHRSTLRALAALLSRWASKLSRGMSLGQWHSLLLKRLPAGVMPVVATCPITADRCRQRDHRWMSGVVVTRDTVGVG